MAKGINLNFAADVRDFLRGTKDIESALDKVVDALDDVESDAKKAGTKIGDSLEDGARDAADSAERVEKEWKKSLESVEDDAKDAGKKIEDHLEDGSKGAADGGDKLEKKFRQAFDTVSDKAKTAGKDIGTETKKGTDKASEGMEEVADAAKSNAMESAASFRGEFSDVGDFITDVVSEAFAGFGPAGVAAGVAAAIGIGMFIGTMEKSAEKAAEAKDRVLDLAEALGEVKGDPAALDWAERLQETLTEIVDGKEWYEFWQDEPTSAMEKWSGTAEKFGLVWSDVANGLTGDQDAIAASLADVNKLIEEQESRTTRISDGYGGWFTAAGDVDGGLLDLRDALEKADAEMDKAIDLNETYQEALEGSKSATDAYNDAIREQNGLLAEQTGAVVSAIEAEMAYIEARDAATATITENGKTLDLNTEAGRGNMNALLDLSTESMNYAQTLADQGATQDEVNGIMRTAREDFLKAADAAGMGATEANNLANELGLIPGSVTATIKVETDAAQRKIDQWYETNNGRRIRIYADLSGTGKSVVGGPVMSSNSGGQVPLKAASGTFVTGPGSDIEDLVPALLSPGEFVVDAQAAQRIGVGNLQAANEGIGRGAATPTPSPYIMVTVYLGDEEIKARLVQVTDERLRVSSRAARAAGRPLT